MRGATFGYEITAMPMLTGTLITAAGFLPIGLAKSMTGEYTFAIFAVTVIALCLSWIVSVYFVPYLGTLLLKTPPHVRAQMQAHEAGPAQPNDMYDTAFYNAFQSAVNACIHHRWLTIAATVALFGLGILGMGQVQQQFFPDSGRPEITVELWSPEGTSFAAGAGISANQCVATDRAAPRPAHARGAAAQAAHPAGAGVPRGAGPRQTAGQRPTGAVPGAVPCDWARPAGAARARRRGQSGDAAKRQHPRRQ